MARQCIVCNKTVAATDVQEHLSANHLGPHYFWFDAREFRTMEPSMVVSDLKRLVDASPLYPVYEDRGGKQIPFGDGVAVDLTREPHFYTLIPATFGMSCGDS